MRERTEVPSDVKGRAFTTADGRVAGLSTKRMLASDLERPFHGVRVEAGGAATLLDRCRAYATRMRPGDFFSHSTAAGLWGCPLPGRFDRADAALHVSTLAPDRAHAGRGVVGHRVGPDTVGLSERHGLPVSDAATTWCDLASVLVRSQRIPGAQTDDVQMAAVVVSSSASTTSSRPETIFF
jgi:hypothetical protein